MCGISGIYHYALATDVDRDLLERMNLSLAHRGPDGDGTFYSQSIGLAHRRLSIIDLKDGGQPIYNEDKSIVIVFNGEIYNYKELRQSLIDNGHTFSTQSDTEVIVHLYEEMGVDCLQELNGMFAFALWDIKKKSLFLARDRLGEKPLFFTHNNGRFLFASELKAILVDRSIERHIDINALDDYLAYGYVPAPKTILQGIHKLPQGHYMLVENQKIDTFRYWDLEFGKQNYELSEADCIEQLNILLEDAIKLQLRSDVPVGAFLSGGIDSSLIVSLASKQSSRPMSTFCVGYPEKDYSELKYARLIADKYQTDHHEIILDSLELSDALNIVSHFDEPFGDASAIPTYYVSQKAGQHVKVCMSGDAGDELFCGYSRYNSEPLEKIIDRLPAKVRQVAFDKLANTLPDHFSGKGRLRRMAVSSHLRWQRKVGPFDPLERFSLFREEYQQFINQDAWLFEPYFQRKDLDQNTVWMFTDQATYLPNDILTKVDRCSMWHGLEIRVPFLDYRIVEFANGMPFQFKKHGNSQKHIIKQLLSREMPEEFLMRPKKGFGLPLKYWLKDRYSQYVSELLLASDSRCTEFINRNAIESLLKNNKHGGRDLSRRIWTLLCLEQWCRSYQV